MTRLDRIEQEARDHANPLVVCDLGDAGTPCVMCCLNKDNADGVLALVAVARAVDVPLFRACITEPRCGDCSGCNLDAALAALEDE